MNSLDFLVLFVVVQIVVTVSGRGWNPSKDPIIEILVNQKKELQWRL